MLTKDEINGWNAHNAGQEPAPYTPGERQAVAERPTSPPQPEPAEYLICKRGYYYRPGAGGYTTTKTLAGRYTLKEARAHSFPNGPDGPRDGMFYIHESKAPENSQHARSPESIAGQQTARPAIEARQQYGARRRALADEWRHPLRITPDTVDAEITDEAYHVFPGTSLTICALTLRNGFVVTGESACADPARFDAELGRDLAKGKARAKVFELLTFLTCENQRRAALWAPKP